ncbi:MAG: YfhO family protein [bacterium]|nr:YfhO family protein [bacterium]
MNKFIPLFAMFGLWILFFFPLHEGKVPMPAEALVTQYFPWNMSDYGLSDRRAAIATDVFRQQLPWLSLVVDEIRAGRWPLWNPYNFSGMPLLANLQSHVFHPSTLLFLLLPLIPAWVIFVVSLPLVAGISMYLFLRALGRSTPASLVGMIGWMGASFIILWLPWGFIPYGIVILPLLLWCVEKLVKDSRWWILFVLLLFAEIVSGYVQVVLYTLMVVGVYSGFVFFRERVHRGRLIVLIVLAFIVSFGLSAIQLLPSWEAYKLSPREGQASSEIFFSYLLRPEYFTTLLAPSFYGNPLNHNLFKTQYHETMLFVGIVVLFFALVSVFGKKKAKLEWFFLLLGLTSILFALPTPLASLPVFLQIPILSSGIPSRIIALTQFSLIVLASFGFDRWRKGEMRNVFFSLFVLGAGLGSLWFIAVTHAWQLSLRALFVPSLVIGTIAAVVVGHRWIGSFRRVAMAAFIVIAMVEAAHFFHRNVAFSSRDLIFPAHPVLSWLQDHQNIDRHYGEGRAGFDFNFSTYYRFFSTEGFDSLYPRRYGELLASARDGQLPKEILRSDAILPASYSAQKERLMNLLGIRYIFHQEGYLDQEFSQRLREKNTPLFREGETLIVENTDALPRVFLASNYEIFSDRVSLIERLYDPMFDQRRTILLEEDPGFSPRDDAEKGSVQIESYLPSSLSMHVQTDQLQLLFLSDQWYPGWTATVDGRGTKIYRANDSFRAVVVPAGSHQVQFTYKPLSFEIGKKMTIGSFLLFLGLSMLFWRNRLL